MGYSARYHATSLIAVFLALAIGILIGAEFGGPALNNTRRELERSLVGNLQDARSRADQLGGQLGRADEFAERVYPVLVRNRLAGKRVAILALGGLPGNVSSAIETALGPTGARLVGVGVVREPVDLRSLAAGLSNTRFSDLVRDPEAQTALGTGIGRQLVRGGSLLDLVRSPLFSQASGNFGRLGGVIVVRDQPNNMGPVQRGTAARLETALMRGVMGTRTPTVGAETSTVEPSSVPFFKSNALSSVDDIDLVAGRVALIFAMQGAEGSFGVKGSADRLLPDLLAPGH
ncbi:MAG: copper transporter [Solirubrobacterales bacterium]